LKTTYWLKWSTILCAAVLAACCCTPARGAGLTKYPLVEVKERSEVTQEGFTWKFAQPVKSGQFVNGDWWVIGPVTVVSVTPSSTPGPLAGEVEMKVLVKEAVKDLKGPIRSVFGWLPNEIANYGTDMRMRNGSMVIERFGPKQGYDSRTGSYDPSYSITYPYKLEANRTLISTISNPAPIAESQCHQIMWVGEKVQRSMLKTVAALTCLAAEPPADAFRPSYAGTDKTIYRAKDLKWDLLLNLKLDNMESYFQKPWFRPNDPNCEVATWADFESYLQKLWLSHYTIDFNEVLWYMQPSDNQPSIASACYGRDDSRIISVASLMLQLDVPQARKEKLLIGLVQRGIDLSGLFKTGSGDPADRRGWIQSGCKWPIVFASMMLDKPELRQFPAPLPFHEDVTTYYGTGWFGQTALWRIIWHDHLIDSCEERSPEQRIGNDGISENYRSYGSSGKAWLGTALTVRLMKAVKIWGHDAWFDYCDRWLVDDPRFTAARGLNQQPAWEKETWDPFVDAMWRAYRNNAPAQESSGQNLKAAWERRKDGWHTSWVANPKPTPEEVADHVAEIHKAFPKMYPAIYPVAFPTLEMIKKRQAEQDQILAKAREECVARTKVSEAEAKAKPAPANTMIVVAATDFSAEDGGKVSVTASREGAVGKVFAVWDKPGHWLEWNFEVPTAGYYYLTLCYCSALDKSEREIKLNGEVQEPFAPMVFPGTGGWSGEYDNWRLFTAQNPVSKQPLLIKFKQGKNLVRLTNTNGRGINVNYLAVTSPDVKVTRELLSKALPQK
jgi:hypothetical protein